MVRFAALGILAASVAPTEVLAWCTKKTTLNGIAERFPGHLGPDHVVRADLGQSLQAAVDGASDTNGDGYIIVAAVRDGAGRPYGSSAQRVVVNRAFPRPFGLVGCSLTLRDPRPQDLLPVARITTAASPADIFVMDLHAEESDVAGWVVEGNGRTLRNAYANRNEIGHVIAGNGNTLRNGQTLENASDGIVVQGSDNVITDMRVLDNGGGGAVVTGDRNLVRKNVLGDRQHGNSGNGAMVLGSGNRVEENKAFANGGDGLAVGGGTAASPNIVRKNASGDRIDKSNLGSGIVVLSGAGNGNPAPVELESNKVYANGGAGIRIAAGATGHELKGNTSGGSSASYDNAGCEYEVASGNLNATSNKSNGATVTGKDGTPFPTGCTGTP